MAPVQVQTNGQIVIFKSRFAFLDVLGYSHAYNQTAHYKSKYGNETPQALWNRTKNARQKLEQLMQTYSPIVDRETGVKTYKHGKVIICPVGYVPPPLREHVTIEPVNGEPNPVAMDLLNLITTRITEEFEKLVQQCEQANGVEAAQELRQSITEIAIGVKSVNGDPNHWLVKHLDEQVFTNNSEI